MNSGGDVSHPRLFSGLPHPLFRISDLYSIRALSYNNAIFTEAMTMISIEKARDLILEQISPLGTERVELLRSLGRVTAEQISAKRDQPPWDNSAMDGFAVRYDETATASPDHPVKLEVVEDIPAGVLPMKSVGPGQASRIMTGAPMPDSADAVIRVEDTRMNEAQVAILQPVEQGENIRRRGEAIREGETVLNPNHGIGPAEVGMLASVGRSHVRVYQRPRVAVLATGDELADLDEELSPNKIMNSNGYTLAAQVIQAGGDPIVLGIARDNPEALRMRLREGLSADIMLVSGGVSVGQYDFVRDVLEQLGAHLAFWKVAMRPGKPLAFGMIQGKPIFGLPGNPVSTMVTFEEFVRPALRKMQGFTQILRPMIEAVLMDKMTKPVGMTHFVRAIVRIKAGRYEVRATGSQSSGILTSMVMANALVVLPPEVTEAPAGSVVKVRLLDKDVEGGF